MNKRFAAAFPKRLGSTCATEIQVALIVRHKGINVSKQLSFMFFEPLLKAGVDILETSQQKLKKIVQYVNMIITWLPVSVDNNEPNLPSVNLAYDGTFHGLEIYDSLLPSVSS